MISYTRRSIVSSTTKLNLQLKITKSIYIQKQTEVTHITAGRKSQLVLKQPLREKKSVFLGRFSNRRLEIQIKGDSQKKKFI